ncbi:phycobiliprotein lyase [Leptolyngbya sp. 'hensonii']|uniref:phycobiliprotein lyase n=1 Tax=Leptolyngbya sp. 'hensonii' TaxID=1922337 RepID=UPI00341F392D
MEFFQVSTGKWRSHRTTHHLAFKRSEPGASEIQIEALAADHPQILEICQLHDVDPSLAIGGAFVSWQGSMGWDREEDSHDGSTIFVLVPDAEHPRQGKLLRERGYAEIVPVIGQYQMDDEDGLILTTEYETTSSIERFWFASPNLRLRTSTVKRFGGFSTATFCTEIRIEESSGLPSSLTPAETAPPSSPAIGATGNPTQYFSFLGW